MAENWQNRIVELESIAVEKLKPHPRNYRTHPDDQVEHLMKSIRENGFYRNIVIAREGTILAGHGVVKAAREMGFESVPVIRLDIDPDDPRALKVLTGDNEIEHLAMQDDRMLTEILKDLTDFDVDGLIGTGFDEQMLANLVFVTRPKDEIEDHDEAAHWVGMPEWEATSRPPKIVVSFRDEADRDAFMQLIKASVVNSKNGSTWSIWWPEKQREDPSSIRFEENSDG